MKKICLILALCLAAGFSMTACVREEKLYTATYFDLFDTVTTVMGRGESEKAFRQVSQKIHDELAYYHRLFDIYHEYEGMNNLKTVNENAGQKPVTVDGELIAFLKDCRSCYDLTEGKVNVAMGSVLQLWHQARETALKDPDAACLPDGEALLEAAEHTDIDRLMIDEEASSVLIGDAQMRLDVGAVAKGWAVEKVAENAPTGMLISVGGNIRVTGPKGETDEAWVIGVQDPEGTDEYLQKLEISGGSVVTSGDYQRFFQVNGVRYHHIIDPQTRAPATFWRSVTVICPDSGLADVLSTALFLMPLEQGQALLEQTGAEAMWVDGTGKQYFSRNFEQWIQK